MRSHSSHGHSHSSGRALRPHIRLYRDDLPNDVTFRTSVAIDTETMGLRHHRDRLCLVQICDANGIVHLVQMSSPFKDCPNLQGLLRNPGIDKIFHYARFDLASLYLGTGVLCEGLIYCTKIASKLVRTYTDYHGLKSLCREMLGTEISKHEQSSDWGAQDLSDAQIHYAASDVLHLHSLRNKLDGLLRRENRHELFESVCRFLPTRVMLDVAGFEEDIFSH